MCVDGAPVYALEVGGPSTTTLLFVTCGLSVSTLVLSAMQRLKVEVLFSGPAPRACEWLDLTMLCPLGDLEA